jgi:hypothetical protein
MAPVVHGQDSKLQCGLISGRRSSCDWQRFCDKTVWVFDKRCQFRFGWSDVIAVVPVPSDDEASETMKHQCVRLKELVSDHNNTHSMSNKKATEENHRSAEPFRMLKMQVAMSKA